MQIFKDVNEFLKQSNLDRFKEHEKCFQHIVNNLDYTTCKKILLKSFTVEELKQAYKKDKYLNNLCKHIDGHWKWDYIGNDMLHNPNAKVKFRLMSDCNRTCIAKACARMVVNEAKE